jgi:type III secretory pathway component EscS
MSNKYVDNPTRSAPLGSLIVGIVFLAINHFLADKLPHALKLLVVLGTLFVSIGIGGLIDPRFFTGVMNEAKGVYPTWVRAVSMTLVALGFIAGGILLVFVYRAFP